VGEATAAEARGRQLLQWFPASKHGPAVACLLLTSMFRAGDYPNCIELGAVTIDKLAKGTKEHDVCLRVLGGSYYHTGDFDKAQPLLDEHAKLYPDSPAAETRKTGQEAASGR